MKAGGYVNNFGSKYADGEKPWDNLTVGRIELAPDDPVRPPSPRRHSSLRYG